MPTRQAWRFGDPNAYWQGNPIQAPAGGPALSQVGYGSSAPYAGLPVPQLPAIQWPQFSLPQLGPMDIAQGMTTGPFPANVLPGLDWLMTAGPQINMDNMGTGRPMLTPGSFARGGGAAPSGPKPAAAAAGGTPWTFNMSTGQNLLQMGNLAGVSNIIGAESGFNPNARNPRSTASGLGQFLDATWMDKDLRTRAGFADVSDKDWKAAKADPTKQIAMTAAYAGRNSEQWSAKFGQAPSPGQVYGMHVLDSSGFIKLTEAAARDPNTSAATLAPAAAASNPELFYEGTGKNRRARSASEVYEQLVQRGQPRDPWTMPQMATLDPRLAASMPQPRRGAPLDLPNAPERPAAPARVAEEEIPVTQWMDQLRAFAPKSFDEKAANEGRLGQVLAGLAQGAASVDARQGIGAMLAAMGAGASRAQTAWVQQVKGERKDADEAVRLFELGLVRQGLDWGGQNIGARQRNRERQWQDQVDETHRTYEGRLANYRNEVQETITNNALDNSYLRDVDQAAQQRWRFGMQLLESQVAATNQQITGQAELDLKRFIFEDEKATRPVSAEQARTVNQMMAGQGLDPKIIVATKDAYGFNAMQGFGYMAAGNKEAAINALGAELAMFAGGQTNGFASLVPDKKKAQELAVLYKQDPNMAQAAMGRLLNEGEAADPGSVLAWAKLLAAQGRPMGTAFMRYTRPAGGPTTPTPQR